MCTARTASSSLLSSVITEIRISDVEIVSMFTPAEDSASKKVNETPGLVFMPAPTSDSLPTDSL